MNGYSKGSVYASEILIRLKDHVPHTVLGNRHDHTASPVGAHHAFNVARIRPAIL